MPSEIPELANTYSNNQEIKLKPFYHTDLKNNLEGIVFKAEPGNDKGMLKRIFSEKSKTLKASVKALLNEIELRENLNLHLLNRIDDEVCSQNTQLIPLKRLRAHYSFELYKEINNLKMQMEDNVLELEQEKRKEYLECWRDLMLLKKYLLVALKDYWDLIKKMEVLESDWSGVVEGEERE